MASDRSIDVGAMDAFVATEWPDDGYLRRAFFAGALAGAQAQLVEREKWFARHDEEDDDEVIAWDPEYRVVRFVTRRGKWT